MKNIMKLMVIGLVGLLPTKIAAPRWVTIHDPTSVDVSDLKMRAELHFTTGRSETKDITKIDIMRRTVDFPGEIPKEVGSLNLNIFGFFKINDDLLYQLIEKFVPYADVITDITLPEYNNFQFLPINLIKFSKLTSISARNGDLLKISSDVILNLNHLKWVELFGNRCLSTAFQKNFRLDMPNRSIKTLKMLLKLDSHLYKKVAKDQKIFLESLAFQKILLSLGVNPETALGLKEVGYGTPRCAVKVSADRVSDYLDVQNLTSLERARKSVIKNELERQVLV